MVRVVERQGDLGEAHGGHALRALEDDVQHLLAAHGLVGEGAEHPLDGVDDVGFAAAVRADDARDPGAKVERRAVGEGFKTAHLELLELHRPLSLPCGKKRGDATRRDPSLLPLRLHYRTRVGKSLRKK